MDEFGHEPIRKTWIFFW